MKFTSTLALVLFFVASAQSAVLVNGTLTFNGAVSTIEMTTEYGEQMALNDAVCMTITQCENGICFNVDMKVVDSQDEQTLRSPAFTAQMNEETIIKCGDALEINVVVTETI